VGEKLTDHIAEQHIGQFLADPNFDFSDNEWTHLIACRECRGRFVKLLQNRLERQQSN
jgi:hypothetical protein